MNNLYFENQGSSTYLVCEISDSDVIDSLSLGMLTNNKIPGLSDTLYTQMDSTKLIKYNVSAKVSVKQFFTGTVNKKRLLGVFSGIVDAMLSAEDYMIDTNTIILDPDYIFTDVSTCETVLICLPLIKESNNSTDLGAFFKNIMFSTQFDQDENCDHVAKLINYLNSAPVFVLADFKALLISIQTNESVSATIETPPGVQPQPGVSSQAKRITPSEPTVIAPKQTTVPGTPTPIYGKPPLSQHPVGVKPPLPQHPVGVKPPQPQAPAAEDTGEKISLYYLLQHYNKENAAIYKQQKAAKKMEKTASQSTAPQKKAKQKPTKQKSTKQKSANNTSFTVPGAPAPNAGFAIPGQPASAPTAQPAASQLASQSSAAFAAAPAQPVYQQSAVLQGQPMNFGETTVLGSENNGETTVLNADQQLTRTVMPHLIRAKNNEKILLNKPVFRIGKERSYVDYFIADNTAISRSHANIISRDGKYFLIDTNSTNHTYLNNQMIQSNSETEIEHGAKICLANEKFEFKIY